MTCVITTVTFRICIETRFWTWIHVLCYSLSLASWFIFVLSLSNIQYEQTDNSLGDSSSYGINAVVSSCAMYWLLGFSCALVALGPRFVHSSFSTLIWPTVTHQVRLQESSQSSMSSSRDKEELADDPSEPSMLTRTPSMRRTTSAVAPSGYATASARMTLRSTNTYDANNAEDDPFRAHRIARLVNTASVKVVCRRWVRGFRQRKAARLAQSTQDESQMAPNSKDNVLTPDPSPRPATPTMGERF